MRAGTGHAINSSGLHRVKNYSRNTGKGFDVPAAIGHTQPVSVTGIRVMSTHTAAPALTILSSLLIVCIDAPGAAPKAPTYPTASERFSSLQKSDEPSFRRHVVPLMSRAGCSGRECHGSFAGQGGFQLSLFGYDFEKDHAAITTGKGGEDEVRINSESPEKSLILMKPTMETRHKGKERLKKNSWEYNLVLKWIQAGAKIDVKETGEFDRLEVTPREIVFKKNGDYAQLRVLAHWKDGTVEDITQLTRFRSNDDSVAAVSDTGRVEAKDAGDTHVVAFYDNGVLPIPVIQPVTAQNGAKYPKVATRTKVDETVVAKLRKLGIVPSEVCTDAEFLRRVSLDLTGTLPTPDEVTKFLADKSPEKRAAKVDELLKTPAYAAWWTTKLCDFTGNTARTLNVGGGGARNYQQAFSRQWYDWIQKRVADNMPYDKIAEGIILASGRTKPDQTYKEFAIEMASYFRSDKPADFAERPNMPYYWQRRTVQKAEEKALAFAHTFLGVRIECAQCHKHPFDQWTKTDFQQFQAFFEPIRYGSAPTRKDEDVTFASVTKEIRDITMKAEEKDRQRVTQQETQKRIDAGEVAPWQEVFVAQNTTPQRGNPKQPNNRNAGGRVLTPKILGGDEVLLNEYPDPRAPLMDWLRHKDNPYFARAWVNRVWANHFGRGIVEPADDMNLANPPVNKELFDHLTDGFVASNYDMKWLHREIVNSDTYQRSWKPTPSNKLDEKNFSRAVIRRLPAEVVVDALAMACAGTEQNAKFASDIEPRAIGPNAEGPARGGGGRATSNTTLAMFGKPARETNCDCERTTDPTLLQTLYTRNDPEMLGRLEAARAGAPAWITELRQQFRQTSRNAAPKDGGEIVALERKIQAMRELTEVDPSIKQKIAEATARLEELKRDLKVSVKVSGPDGRAVPVNDKNRAGATGVVALDGEPLDKIIAEVFLRTVSRPPTARETVEARKDIASARDPIDGVRDLLWAMLNTREFMVNH